MTRVEAAQLVAILFGSYPSAHIERTHVDAFVSGIIDLDARAASEAVTRLRRTSKFLPSIAEIREAATAQRVGPVKTGAEAYGELLAAVQRHGSYPEVRWVGGKMLMQSPWPPLQPDVLTAMRQTWGTWTECCAETGPDAPDRARFITAYDGIAERERQDLVSGQALPEPQNGTQRLRAAPVDYRPVPAVAPTPAPVATRSALQGSVAPTPPAESDDASTRHVGALVNLVVRRPQPAPADPSRLRKWTAEELDAELAAKAGGGTK